MLLYDFIFAYLSCLSKFAFALAVTGTIALILSNVGTLDPGCDEDLRPRLKRINRTLTKVLIGLWLFAALPSPESLWAVRITLLKLGTATPENVNRGIEAVGRVGKKLECKYLGGCAEEKPAGKP